MLESVVPGQEHQGHQHPRQGMGHPPPQRPLPDAPGKNQDHGRAHQSPDQGLQQVHGLLVQTLDEERQFNLRAQGLGGKTIHAELAPIDGQFAFEP